MSSPEHSFQSVPAAEKEQVPQDVKSYFQGYVADAEAQESNEGKDAFVDLDTIKGILNDLDNGDNSSAREYLDAEISRIQSMHQEPSEPGHLSDAEESRPYLEKITALRSSLG